MKPYLFVHGGYAGGWVWRKTEQIISAKGHAVFTPTLTGLGERVHLATPEIGLETYLQDIINVLEFEDLRDVVLVGHSFGGMVITGVAGRVPERIAQLIYLDALLPEHGQSFASMLGPEFMAVAMQLVQGFDGFRYPPSPESGPNYTPMLVKPCTDPLRIDKTEQLAALPRAFIYCTGDKHQPDPVLFPVIDAAGRVRDDSSWQYVEVAYNHDIMLADPIFLADLLLSIAQPAPQV
jgi:pimeloyl-ACP methyl ester carboxylesterase